MAETNYTYEKKIDRLVYDVDDIKKDINEIKMGLKNDFVTQDQFDPVRKIVYGLVTLVLTGVVTALIALVIKR